MVVIRAGSVADAAQVAAVQREGWFAAYAGIIPAEVIDRVTAPDDGARVRQSFRTRPWQRMLVAVAAEPERPGKTPGPGGAPAGPGVVGYASFGPETDVLNAAWPHPTSTDGEDGRVGELYARRRHQRAQPPRRRHRTSLPSCSGSLVLPGTITKHSEIDQKHLLDF